MKPLTRWVVTEHESMRLRYLVSWWFVQNHEVFHVGEISKTGPWRLEVCGSFLVFTSLGGWSLVCRSRGKPSRRQYCILLHIATYCYCYILYIAYWSILYTHVPVFVWGFEGTGRWIPGGTGDMVIHCYSRYPVIVDSLTCLPPVIW